MTKKAMPEDGSKSRTTAMDGRAAAPAPAGADSSAGRGADGTVDTRVDTGADTGADTAPSRRDRVIADTRAWVRGAVVGLDLCPFAKGPEARGRVRYVVSEARSEDALLVALLAELEHLAAVDERECETTLLLHPDVLDDFLDYNDFVGRAEDLIADRGFEGVVQLATFHPHYRFAGTGPDDLGNATNRSPYPTLQLLRERSVERAVAAVPDAATIYEANLATLDALGREGWAELQRSWLPDGAAEER